MTKYAALFLLTIPAFAANIQYSLGDTLNGDTLVFVSPDFLPNLTPSRFNGFGLPLWDIPPASLTKDPCYGSCASVIFQITAPGVALVQAIDRNGQDQYLAPRFSSDLAHFGLFHLVNDQSDGPVSLRITPTDAAPTYAPEPATLALCALTLLSLTWHVRRAAVLRS